MDVKIYDKLANQYDLATKIVSFGIEEIWRWIFIRNIKKVIKNGVMVDLASATGGMSKVGFDKIYFVEPSSEMIKVMVEKFKKLGFKESYEVQFIERPYIKINKDKKEYIILQNTAEDFEVEKADLITAFMAFRNFDDIKKASANIDKHLKDGGYLAIVEMFKNDGFIAKIVMWYMNNIVPFIAGFLFGRKKEYKLLGKSIEALKEDDILKYFKNYKILRKRRLFPIATMIIMRKNERKNS